LRDGLCAPDVRQARLASPLIGWEELGRYPSPVGLVALHFAGAKYMEIAAQNFNTNFSACSTGVEAGDQDKDHLPHAAALPDHNAARLAELIPPSYC